MSLLSNLTTHELTLDAGPAYNERPLSKSVTLWRFHQPAKFYRIITSFLFQVDCRVAQ